MNTLGDNSEPGERYHYRFFKTSFKNDDTEKAVESIVRKAIFEHLGLRDIFLFCALADEGIHNYTSIDEDGAYRLSFAVDPLKVYPKLPKRYDFEVEYPADAAVAQAKIIAEKIEEKVLELVPSYKNAPDVKMYSDDISIGGTRTCWVDFSMPRDQFRKLAVQLDIAKEFNQIISADDARRAEAQEHLDAANRVLSGKLPEGCRIVKIVEGNPCLIFSLSRPIKVSEREISSTAYPSEATFDGYLKNEWDSDGKEVIFSSIASDIFDSDKEFAKNLGLTEGKDINLASDCGIYRETFTILGEANVRKFYEDVEKELKAMQPPPREKLRTASSLGTSEILYGNLGALKS
jgi:hypothetical protein